MNANLKYPENLFNFLLILGSINFCTNYFYAVSKVTIALSIYNAKHFTLSLALSPLSLLYRIRSKLNQSHPNVNRSPPICFGSTFGFAIGALHYEGYYFKYTNISIASDTRIKLKISNLINELSKNALSYNFLSSFASKNK